VFRAELVSAAPASWEELFGGYTTLKAITLSSSIELLMRLAERLDDMEVVFGSKPILSKEHLAPAQASQTVQTYGFVDALADQKALVEALSRLLGRSGKALLDRVVAGTLRFRLLRGRPSHEKLYLLSGPAGRRVLTGAANLRLAAFEGRQHEVHIAFDGDAAWQLFDGYYQRDCKDRVPVEPDALVVRPSDGAPAPRDAPLTLQEVPIVRVLNSGVALMDQPPRPVPAGLATDALRQAAVIGAELKDLALPKDKAGRTIVNAASVLRVIRTHLGRPVADAAEDCIPRAEIYSVTGTVRLDGRRWLAAEDAIPAEAVASDARILADYLDSFRAFFGNATGAMEVYWAFLVWLYAAPAAPFLRQATVPVGIDPWVYPVYAVLFGRSSGRQDPVHARCRAFDVRLREDDPQRPVHRQPGAGPARTAGCHPAADRRRDARQVHQPCAGPGPHRPGNERAVRADRADDQPRCQHHSAGSDQAHGDVPHRCRDPGKPLRFRTDRPARAAGRSARRCIARTFSG
jgi:hypothetical protein